MTREKIALGLGGLLVGVLLGEVLLGWLAPQVYRHPRVWEFDPELGWRHVAGARGTLVTPEFAVELTINAEGLRDRPFARKPAPDTWRLLAFGDSFVEGWGVPLEASVSKRLERCLQEAFPDRKIEVINFGVAGYGTDQELLFFDRLGRLYEPDEVLVFFSANDLWNNASNQGIGTERGYKPYFRPGPGGRLQLSGVPVRKIPSWEEGWEEAQPWPRRLDGYLRHHWHLYVLLRKALTPAELGKGQRQQFYEGLYGRDPSGKWIPLWELSGLLLRAFKERVEQTGAKFLLIYVPAIVQVEEEDWRQKRELHGLLGEYDLDRPSRQLSRFAQEYQLRFLDLLIPFREAAAKETLYFRDSHWNEQGHALAAQVIADFLIQHQVQVGERGE